MNRGAILAIFAAVAFAMCLLHGAQLRARLLNDVDDDAAGGGEPGHRAEASGDQGCVRAVLEHSWDGVGKPEEGDQQVCQGTHQDLE